MSKIAIVYGSTTDNTKNIAETIAKKLSGENITLLDVSKLKAGDLDAFSNLIFGTSTWGLGDLQDDWDVYISNLESANLSGKTIAFFGLGDSGSYPDTFVDGMGILYEMLANKGAVLIGEFPTDGYNFDTSRAEINGKFVGVAIDEDNESSETDNRLNAWIESIKPLFV